MTGRMSKFFKDDDEYSDFISDIISSFEEAKENGDLPLMFSIEGTEAPDRDDIYELLSTIRNDTELDATMMICLDEDNKLDITLVIDAADCVKFNPPELHLV